MSASLRDRAGRPTDQDPAGLGDTATIPSAVLGFTGTQHGLNDWQKELLVSALTGFRESGALWMHNGDCVGADEYAGKTWNALGGAIHLHPPVKDGKRAFLNRLSMVVSSPERSYMERNRDIANAATVLIAAPLQTAEQPKGGTWYTVRAARQHQLPIMLILRNGQVLYERWPASAMSAGTAETQSGSGLQPASAVPTADAQGGQS